MAVERYIGRRLIGMLRGCREKATLKVKQGMKHANCQVILTRVDGGAAGFTVPGWAVLI